MQITRLTSLDETEARGCASAFAEALDGELNGAALYLRKLEGARKGSAFAFEMALDRHRYAALLLLERWAQLDRAFGEHAPLLRGGAAKAAGAEQILTRANALLDQTPDYGAGEVAACQTAFQSIRLTFEAERQIADQMAKLGPMIPETFQRARRIFAGDLAAR